MVSPHAKVGAAIHSIRAVPREQMHQVVTWAHGCGAPLHVHMSEQQAENDVCRAFYGVSPARLLYEEDVLGPRTTVVHATHVDAADPELLGGCARVRLHLPHHRTGPGRRAGSLEALAEAGCTLTLGSDSHAVIDILEEARGVEYAERLAHRPRPLHRRGPAAGRHRGRPRQPGLARRGRDRPRRLGRPGHRLPGQRPHRRRGPAWPSRRRSSRPPPPTSATS